MKNVQLLFIAFVSVMCSCSNSKEKQTEKITSFISGTYVRAFKGEYSIGNDTLVISQPEAGTNLYLIQHNSSYQKIREKKLQSLEYKTENWTAIFDNNTNILIEQKMGKVLTFLPAKNELLLGSNPFKKLNKL